MNKCPKCGFEEKKKGQLTLIQFGIFWMNYPRKVGKGQAEKIWLKIKGDPELFDQIIQAINEQKNGEAWTKDNGVYIPHPATWLNQRRWEDEVTRTARKFENYHDQVKMDAAAKRMEDLREKEFRRLEELRKSNV